MNIGRQIAFYRRKLNITQDALAQKLEVTNQAVSKWESGQCCPDISLLPRLADIFSTTIDALFDRRTVSDLPWADDETLHVAIFHGRTYIGHSDACTEMTFQYEGPALNIDCALNLRCDAVSGNVTAGGSVECDDVYGSVKAGGNVACDDVNGNVHAGGSITCDVVEGDAEAGSNITCAEICGAVTAKGDVYCDEINVESPAGRSGNIHIHKEEKAAGNTHTITYTISKD